MKSICNLFVFGSIGVLAAALAGCGDDDSAGGASCVQVCTMVDAAKCANDPDCMSTCNSYRDSTPMGCMDTYSALTSCYAVAKFTCDGDKQSVAKECSKQESAYAVCVKSGGKEDGNKDAGAGDGDDTQGNAAGKSGNAGAGDTGGTSGDNSCEGVAAEGACGKCLTGSCCDGLLACQKNSDCLALNQCVGECSDSSCEQTCANAASSSAFDLYNTFVDCASEHCESDCTDDSASGSEADTSGGASDVGAPNDGDGGHASSTTPTDCLEVPSDATGYCEEVKYKVIYDCPDGAPYGDCELNKVDASGIYCCGE